MRLNFGKGEHNILHFYYCSAAKWISQFHSCLLFTLAAKWFIIIAVFATITFVPTLLPSVMCCIPSEQPRMKLKLFHGCPNKNKKIGKGSKVKNKIKVIVAETVTTTLTTWWKKKSPWNCENEIQAGPFCDWESAKKGGSHLALPDFVLSVMHLKEWTLLKWLKLKGLENKFFMYYVRNDCKCEDSNDGAFLLSLKKINIYI